MQVWKRIATQVPAALALGGLILTLVAHATIRRIEGERLGVAFEQRAKSHSELIEMGLRITQLELEALARYLETNGQVSRQGFHDNVSALLANEPSFQAIEWVPRVPAEERAEHESAARLDGVRGYSITERSAGGAMVPAQARPEYYPVQFLEPLASNTNAFGFDLGSERHRRTALELARDSGKPAATPPLTLVQQSDEGASFLLFAPVYRGKPTTLAERQRMHTGFILGVYRMKQVVNVALKQVQAAGIHITLYDVSDPDDVRLLHRHQSRTDSKEQQPDLTAVPGEAPGLQHTRKITVAGRDWKIVCSPVAELLAQQQHWTSKIVLAGGLLMTVLLAIHLRTLQQSNRRVVALVEDRTRELEKQVQERSRAERELGQSEGLLQVVFNATPIIFALKDVHLVYQAVNPRFCQLVGRPESEIVGSTDYDLFPEAEASLHAEENARVLREDKPSQHELYAAGVGGSGRWLSIERTPIHDATTAELNAVLCSIHDITDQRAAQAELQEHRAHLEDLVHLRTHALRESEEKYRSLCELSRDAILVLDPSSGYLDCNPAALRLFGAKRKGQLLDSSLRQLSPEFQPDGSLSLESFMGMTAIAMRSGNHDYEWIHLRMDGTQVSTSVSIARLELQGHVLLQQTIRDMTERERVEQDRLNLERQVLHTQKLESLGVLAGGIAHDFNNLLTGIMGNASLAAANLPADSPAHDRLENVETAALRAAELCRQMLAYAGKGRFVIENVDLSDIIRGVLQLLSSSISRKVQLQLELAEDLPPVEADATQLRQVVMNLIINASEAIASTSDSSDAGTITIRTASIDRSQAFQSEVIQGKEFKAGKYVMFEVRDTGCGMNAQTRERLFEPFFTTKFTGRGLGLSAIHGIVRGHGGAIQVESEVGQGASFTVLLPANEGSMQEEEQDVLIPQPRKLRGKVLVVDDEEIVCNLARRTLEMAGCDVLTAESGGRAVEILESGIQNIDLVVLDLTMPDMDGLETLQKLRGIDSHVRVLLSSGYGEDDATARFRGLSLVGFLQKPYTAAELTGRLAGYLGGDGQG